MTTAAITIEAKNMPGFTGAVSYKITGETAELVQREIDRLFNQVEQVGGCAEFDNPHLVNGLYFSKGYTFIVNQKEV